MNERTLARAKQQVLKRGDRQQLVVGEHGEKTQDQARTYRWVGLCGESGWVILSSPAATAGLR